VQAILQKTFGADKVFENPRISASEDVGAFSLPGHRIPMTYFGLGAADPAQLAAAHTAGKELAGPHTNKFLPDPEPTIATGVQSLTAVATSLLP